MEGQMEELMDERWINEWRDGGMEELRGWLKG